jgi:hypothetical protein
MGDCLWAMLAPVSWGTRSATAACVALPNVIGDRAPKDGRDRTCRSPAR